MLQHVFDHRTTRQEDASERPLEVTYIGTDESLAELYKLKLELDGYWVTVAPTIADSLDGARRRAPDLVYLDAGPTTEAAVESLRSLRLDGALKDTPVIVLWRGGSDALAIADLQLGVTDFLVTAIGVPVDGHGLDREPRPRFRA